MLFELEHTNELFTPTITHTGVNEANPLLTSREVCHLDENDIDFADEHLTELVNLSQSHDNSDEQQDLFTTFDFPVLNELNRTGRKKNITNRLFTNIISY